MKKENRISDLLRQFELAISSIRRMSELPEFQNMLSSIFPPQPIKIKAKKDTITEVIEEKEKIIVVADVGVNNKDKIKVRLSQSVLHIETPDIKRDIPLPQTPYKASESKAVFKNGILEVTVPKNLKKGEKIKIDIEDDRENKDNNTKKMDKATNNSS